MPDGSMQLTSFPPHLRGVPNGSVQLTSFPPHLRGVPDGSVQLTSFPSLLRGVPDGSVQLTSFPSLLRGVPDGSVQLTSFPSLLRGGAGVGFPCINIRKRAYKYTVELSLSKSATFSLQKFPFHLLKVPLLECESGTFGKHFLNH